MPYVSTGPRPDPLPAFAIVLTTSPAAVARVRLGAAPYDVKLEPLPDGVRRAGIAIGVQPEIALLVGPPCAASGPAIVELLDNNGRRLPCP
jgi:hypothetical protein